MKISLWASRCQARGRGQGLGTLRDWPGKGTGITAAAHAETAMFLIQWDQSDMSHLPTRDLTGNSAVQCKTGIFTVFAGISKVLLRVTPVGMERLNPREGCGASWNVQGVSDQLWERRGYPGGVLLNHKMLFITRVRSN